MKITQEKGVEQDKAAVGQPRIPSFMFISVIIGGILTTLFYLLVVQLIYRGTYIETIFTRRGPIPYMTTYFAFVALTQLCGLFMHLRYESRNLELVSEVLSRRERVDLETAPSIRREIFSYLKPSAQKGLVLSRVRRVLHRVENNGGSSDVAALLSEQAEIDRAILSNSFAAIRFIVWLIPILGFIGTIYGISWAIAGFPALFERASDNIGDQLGPITENLGVAFETTLLALIKVAIVQFVVFAVQKRGSQLLNASDEFCLDNLLGKVPHAGLIDEEDLPNSLRHFARILLHHVETMEERFENAVQQVVDKLVENEQQRWSHFTDTFRAVAGEHEALVRQTCESIREQSEVLSGELSNFEPKFRATLQEVTAELRQIETQHAEQVVGALAQSGQNSAEALKQAGDELRQGMESMSGQLRDFEPSLRACLEEMTGQLREIESQHVQQVAIALTDAGDRTSNALTQAGQDNTNALKMASEELGRGMGDIEELLRSSEDLQAIQQILHSNLAALTKMDQVRTTLQGMNDCTEKLVPVLRELQKRRRMQVRIEDEFEGQLDGSTSEDLEEQ